MIPTTRRKSRKQGENRIVPGKARPTSLVFWVLFPLHREFYAE
jgi:hypothetical protein